MKDLGRVHVLVFVASQPRFHFSAFLEPQPSGNPPASLLGKRRRSSGLCGTRAATAFSLCEKAWTMVSSSPGRPGNPTCATQGFRLFPLEMSGFLIVTLLKTKLSACLLVVCRLGGNPMYPPDPGVHTLPKGPKINLLEP